MDKKLHNFLNDAFKPYGNEAGVKEIKQELHANLSEKYADLKAGGMSDDDAYKATIDSLGDVSEIMEHMPRKDATTVKKEFKPNLSAAALRNADLAGTSLRDLDIKGSDLRGSDFSKADLTGTSFIGCDLTNVKFDGANLHGAELKG